MASPSRPSRESTTRSSRFPQNGNRITARVYHRARERRGPPPPFLHVGGVFGGDVFPAQAFPQEERQPRHQHWQRADDVEEHGHGHTGIDVEGVEAREHELTGFMETS